MNILELPKEINDNYKKALALFSNVKKMIKTNPFSLPGGVIDSSFRFSLAPKIDLKSLSLKLHRDFSDIEEKVEYYWMEVSDKIEDFMWEVEPKIVNGFAVTGTKRTVSESKVEYGVDLTFSLSRWLYEFDHEYMWSADQLSGIKSFTKEELEKMRGIIHGDKFGLGGGKSSARIDELKFIEENLKERKALVDDTVARLEEFKEWLEKLSKMIVDINNNFSRNFESYLTKNP